MLKIVSNFSVLRCIIVNNKNSFGFKAQYTLIYMYISKWEYIVYIVYVNVNILRYIKVIHKVTYTSTSRAQK